MNRRDLVIIITDQERFPQHWPEGLRNKLMPSWTRLESHGLKFNNAFCAATQCSPSRAVMFTGQYAPKNGVPTLEFPANVMEPSSTLPNLGSLLRQNGYDVAFKGKWHLSFPLNFEGGSPSTEDWTEADVTNFESVYGLPGWNPPDAGNNAFNTPAARTTLGGGTANNDGRFVSGPPPEAIPAESVIDYLTRMSKTPRLQRAPFCLFVSLVNPHDIAYFPNGWDQAGYQQSEFAGMPIQIPLNAADPLVFKPQVQRAYMQALEKEGPLDQQGMVEYGQFYAYLHSVIDAQITKVLDTMDETGLSGETVILRTADHGELGLSHGLREKAYSAYEEMIHVPLCVSNPQMFPVPLETNAFWSHVDLMATVCDLAGVKTKTAGFSQAPVLANPSTHVRNSVLFAFDDSFLLDPATTTCNQHIRALRTAQHTYAVYFSTTNPAQAFEYELYDNLADPLQMTNLLSPRAPSILPLWVELDTQLQMAMAQAGALPPASVPWQPPKLGS